MQKLQQRIDKIAVAISAIMLAAMMFILVFNIILRYTPGVGGVKWYMESTQYLNVWSMFVVGIAISVKNEHLNVSILEGMTKGIGKTIVKIIVALFTVLFYLGLAYGTFLLASKSKQVISTMPMLKMSFIYWLIPVSSILCAISTVIGLVINLNEKYQTKGGVKV